MYQTIVTNLRNKQEGKKERKKELKQKDRKIERARSLGPLPLELTPINGRWGKLAYNSLDMKQISIKLPFFKTTQLYLIQNICINKSVVMGNDIMDLSPKSGAHAWLNK